jgi:hypothetical protein
MQVVCATCQLSFDAPEGATGLVCPICRGPLRPQAAAGTEGDGAGKKAQEWSGGDLDDLIAILSAPAVSARVEVLGKAGETTGDAVIGEVHLLAGGVSDSIYQGKATDDALDRLRADKPTRFRVELRLPNPVDGNLSEPGPETGTLDGRALAHLMRYCEDYVISCAIDVWRGNETARVEYKRGEISGVTVGGIDAPERLAEVMQWSSGNYRLVVPEFKLPASAPRRAKSATATPAPVPAPAPSAQAARNASSTKTIFGMPVAEVAKARAAAEAAKEANKSAAESARSGSQPAAPRVATPVPVVAPAPVAPRVAPVVAAPTPTPAPAPAPMTASRDSATKTIFGVPAPRPPEGFSSTQRASQPGAPALSADADSARTETAKVDRKTGARKVDVPGPAVAAPTTAPTTAPTAPAAAPPPAAAAPIAAAGTEPSERQPTTTPGFDPRGAVRKRPEPGAAAPAEKQPRQQTQIWTYVGVGFAFGLLLLGIYQLYGLLAH